MESSEVLADPLEDPFGRSPSLLHVRQAQAYLTTESELASFGAHTRTYSFSSGVKFSILQLVLGETQHDDLQHHYTTDGHHGRRPIIRSK